MLYQLSYISKTKILELMIGTKEPEPMTPFILLRLRSAAAALTKGACFLPTELHQLTSVAFLNLLSLPVENRLQSKQSNYHQSYILQTD